MTLRLGRPLARLAAVVAIAILGATAPACDIFASDDDSSGHVDGGAGSLCAVPADCAGGLVCAGGFCQSEGSVGLGGNCWANRDCASDLYCTVAGVCGPAGTGAVGTPCTTGAECEKELTCELSGFGGNCATAGTGDLGEPCSGPTDCIGGLACGSAGTCQPPAVAYPPFAGVECEPDSSPFKAYFEVPRPGAPPADFYRLPFPNDARVDAAGHLDMSDFPRPGVGLLGIDLVDLYVDALVADFAGFSSTATVTFRFSGELDFGSIGDGGANVHFIDVTDPTDPGFGGDRARRYGYSTGRNKFLCQQHFTIANDPTDPLQPGHRYAVFLSSAIRSTTGAAAALDDDLAAVLADSAPTDPTLAHVWEQYANFRAYLAGEGLTAADVAAVTVFTVQDTVGRAQRLRDAVAALPPPALSEVTLCGPGVVSPCDDGTPARACGAPDAAFYEIHGKFNVPMYQQGTTPFATPDDGGGIVEENGVPVQQGSFDVCFAMTIPKSAVMPAGGWPLLVYAHGTGGNMRGFIGNGVAAQAAGMAQPVAVFSYDGVVHGARRAGASRDEDSLMFNVVNPRAARDNNLQGAVDVMQALRLPQVTGLAVDTVGAVAFDPDRVYYFGHSQGSNVGIPAIAVDDGAAAAIFSGAGSYLTLGILTKTSPVDAKAGLELLLGEPLDEPHPLMVIWQTFFDSVDTVNYDALVLRRPPAGVASKHVFMTWGQGDTYSPTPTLEVTARAMGLQLAAPVVAAVSGLQTVERPVSLNRNGGDGTPRTAAMFQYVPVDTDGHFVSTDNPTAVADWSAFLESLVGGGAPTVP
jgi:hypothetical protein